MNLETNSSSKKPAIVSDDLSMDDFDFKPITSGLGFHQPKPQEVKPIFTDRTIPVSIPTTPVVPVSPVKKEMQVYQNDLSLFYGQTSPQGSVSVAAPVMEEREEKVQRQASKVQRIFAYLVDLLFVTAVLAGVLTVMAQTIDMDMLEVWKSYPHEITPLVVTLFIGFYMMYFSIFEKASSSTIGKNLLSIRVVSQNGRSLSFAGLLCRSLVSLLNFLSLGLFSYFDLQNKVTGTKVIRID